ncbi:MAG: GNAT family N-acetyltransferase [Dehalococcoidia bacterium]|jgi:RimJ/RimL family protein N-acetyltransferase|nr:GNAT family N-acetyltransferase [Dehalococcoidia bacterium]
MPLRRDIDLLKVEIVTERLIFRPTSIVDLMPIFEQFNERVTRYMYPPPARSSVETAAFIADSIERMNNRTNLQLTILRKGMDDRFAGCLGLHHPESRTPEIGIWLAEKWQGAGLGFEAVDGLCGWAAEEVEFDYLKYPVDLANRRSRNIPIALGADIEDEYDRITPDGRTLNIVEYRIYPESI